MLERSRSSVGRAVERKGKIGVVDGDRCDRELLALRVRDPNPDLAGSELDPADVELVGGGGAPADEIEQRRARRGEQRDDADEQEDRHERPQPPGGRNRLRSARSRPPSVDDLEEAHPAELGELRLVSVEHERPVLWKSISMIPRWPWQSITVSVYS